jgi:hypothetical protein
MRLNILSLALLSGLLLTIAHPAQAAKKTRTAPKAAASDPDKLPPQNWGLISSGFNEVFKLRNREVESTEPNRFFPASVAFALGRMDESGHFLMLKCYGSENNCNGKRDDLEDRLVFSTLLEVMYTKGPKDMLFDARTWALTSRGNKYIEQMRKRYPDFSARLGRLIGAALADKS